MTPRPIWKERSVLVNPLSLGSTAALGMAAIFLASLDTPGRGGMFGAAVVVVLMVYLLVTMFMCEIKVNADHITVGILPYRKVVPIASLIRSEARLVNDEDPLRLRIRRNGIGLPGMQLGWFSTSGKPVFAATTGKRNRVLIPTTGSYDLLVTSGSPMSLVATIQTLPSTSRDGWNQTPAKER